MPNVSLSLFLAMNLGYFLFAHFVLNVAFRFYFKCGIKSRIKQN